MKRKGKEIELEVNLMNCYLSEKCKAEHEMATSTIYTQKLYRVGRLFGGRSVCLWCLFHLDDLVKPSITDSDARELEGKKKRFANYWRIIEEMGVGEVIHEIGMQWIEAQPSSLPIRPEQLYPKLEVSVGGIGDKK